MEVYSYRTATLQLTRRSIHNLDARISSYSKPCGRTTGKGVPDQPEANGSWLRAGANVPTLCISHRSRISRGPFETGTLWNRRFNFHLLSLAFVLFLSIAVSSYLSLSHNGLP